MTLIGDIAAELIGMFASDARLSLGVLAVVIAAAALAAVPQIDPLVSGAVLLFGCLAVLVVAVRSAMRGPGRP